MYFLNNGIVIETALIREVPKICKIITGSRFNFVLVLLGFSAHHEFVCPHRRPLSLRIDKPQLLLSWPRIACIRFTCLPSFACLINEKRISLAV